MSPDPATGEPKHGLATFSATALVMRVMSQRLILAFLHHQLGVTASSGMKTRYDLQYFCFNLSSQAMHEVKPCMTEKIVIGRNLDAESRRKALEPHIFLSRSHSVSILVGRVRPCVQGKMV